MTWEFLLFPLFGKKLLVCSRPGIVYMIDQVSDLSFSRNSGTKFRDYFMQDIMGQKLILKVRISKNHPQSPHSGESYGPAIKWLLL